MNRVLVRVTGVKDLGVLMTSDLSFQPHVDNICSQACKMLGFIKRSCGSQAAPTTGFSFFFC